MSDTIRNGAAWLADQLKASAGTAVEYRRGTASATATAVVGRSVFESQDQSGVSETWEARDYIFRTADFPHSEPKRGDRIVETLAGVSVVFEVVSPRGVPLFHHGDPFHSTIRVHTKRVGVTQ